MSQHNPTWQLQDREPVATAYGGSGQADLYAVRIEWSEKLGLHLECSSRAQAERMAQVIKQAGKLNPERWEKYFLGNHRDLKRWTTFYAD